MEERSDRLQGTHENLIVPGFVRGLGVRGQQGNGVGAGIWEGMGKTETSSKDAW